MKSPIEMPNPIGKPFLIAEWRYLAMLSYEVDPEVLLPLVPRGTELDAWHGKTFASMVGFLFLNTRVMGISIPFHQNFEDINLRFYVRRKAEDGWRRGVVFVKEIVPRTAVALVARRLYNENYIVLPTGNAICRSDDAARVIDSVKYYWTFNRRPQLIEIMTRGAPTAFVEDSPDEFIVQHYWGYSAQRDGGTAEYRVDHPTWRLWQAASARLDCDVEALYGAQFVKFLRGEPASAFLAEGSAITVYRGRRIA